MQHALVLIILAVFSLSANAQTSNNGPIIPGFPASFHWRNNPASWNVKDGVLTITAAEKTDWFISPTDGQEAANSPVLLFPAPKDFWFSAKVTVNFQSQFDAGVLAIYADEKNWVKFCFENTSDKKPSIVSVVTRGLSDDNTGTVIGDNTVYLKVSKAGQAIFPYFSTDGTKWKLTRAFNLGPERSLQFGFSAQSPMGSGSTVTFSDIHYKPERLNFWTGD
jgi:regulation of enolase protein 1 (concanavalin A-like superfamily)